MSHSLSKASESEVLSYFEQLWSLLLDPEPDMGSKLERLLPAEADELNLDFAFLARIDDRSGVQHFEVAYGPNGEMQPEEDARLSDTYCGKTIREPAGTLAISDAESEGWQGDPAYERWGFSSYVGTTVTVEGDLYGTLCFASIDPRDEQFTAAEITIVEMLGQWVSYELNQWTGPQPSETAIPDTDVETAPLSPQVDNMIDALGSRQRRFILLTLLDSTPRDDFSVLERAADALDVQVQLHHIHLPKLEAGGYIDWDRNTNTISQGPNFPEIKPLLGLLKAYTGEFSE